MRRENQLWLSCVLVGLTMGRPALATESSPDRTPAALFEPPGNTVLHAASLPETWDTNGLKTQFDTFNRLTGKKLAVITWFASLYEMGRMTSWRHNYAAALDRVRSVGALSLVKFSVQDYAYPQTHRMANPQQIAEGVYDAYFDEFADTVKDFGGPVFLSINHEMNGNWYPYSEAYPGSGVTAADYVASWRHIVDIFHRHRVTNVAFVWSPNVPDVGGVPFTRYYPGDAYVDWVGVSLYSGSTVSSLDSIYRTYATRKPFFITEWATAAEKNRYNPAFPGEAKWVTSVFQALENSYPRIKAISWFQWKKDDGDYLLQRQPDQQQTYQSYVASSRYLDRDPTADAGHPSAQPRLERPGQEIILHEPVRPETVKSEHPAPESPGELSPHERIHLQVIPTER